MKKDAREILRQKYFKWLAKQEHNCVNSMKKITIKDYFGNEKTVFYRGYGDLERHHYYLMSPYYYDRRCGYKYGYPRPFTNNSYWDFFLAEGRRNQEKYDDILWERRVLQKRNERRVEFLKKQRTKICEEKLFFENLKFAEIIKNEIQHKKVM